MPLEFVTRRIAMLPGQPEPEPIRLRTLLMLRWVAVCGQLGAVAAALFIGVHVPLVPVLATIALTIMLNIWLSLRPAHRVSDREAALQLGFDLWQISTLLALTGGMTNPFALLVLAPVTIAATSLPARHMIALGLATLVMVTIAGLVAEPLGFETGGVLALDEPYQFGHWVAIVIGVVFLSSYAHRVSSDLVTTSNALFAARMALEREQKLQHLGGVVAAAAHEMGTPLATIKLVSAELVDELSDILPSRPDIAEDLAILRQSADRCSAILKSMGRAGKDDLLIRTAPIEDVLTEAARPHMDRGIEIVISASDPTLSVYRDAAIIHGVRNLIQNGVDFATHRVEVRADWTPNELCLQISDDGPGYPPAIFTRLGSPFLTTRHRAEDGRGYNGMGLGLFIAKTLLERTGAELSFANSGHGAVASVVWPRQRIEAGARGPLGENPEIQL
ncbi:ActS/PrrB/RegB family redox-sensitive histidine kinase [Paracoccus sp. (in: a-proteobacteria)]|uniref:ActS/PrrB/RegB family redox-sensitive histidine kinase n=1 Tax=Paracoccus sp. TaxID=267 RepID=UPI0028A27861|nr:ActS/PrrB/RegB family redox-sensitive histidine kinase [Paracoccus sp. (in: a-proteobacteria)]